MSSRKQARADQREASRSPPPGPADHLPQDPTTVPLAAESARHAEATSPPPLLPSQLLALQSTMGNQAVQRTLNRMRNPRASPPLRRLKITGGLPPSTVAREFRPPRNLTASITIRYDPVTNQLRMVGPGDEAYLREHTPGGNPTLDRASRAEGSYLTVNVASLDREAQGDIAEVLGVDRRVLTGTRPAPPAPSTATAAGTPDAPLTPQGEWDAQAILNRLTQIDRFRETIFDRFRCGPTSALAVHIMGGWDAVRSVAQSLQPRVNQIRATDSDATIRSCAAEYLRGIQAFTVGAMARATYRHLSLLADALFLVVRYDRIHEIIRTGVDVAIGTREEELGAVSGMGHAHVSTGWPDFVNSVSAWFGGQRRLIGHEAIRRLPARGERFGMADLRQVVSELRGFTLVSLIIAVPYGTRPGPGGRQYIEEGALTHYIALVVDGQGRAFVYDPYPRGGNQVIAVRGNQSQLQTYFMGRWRVDGRLAAASAGARGPAEPPPIIDIDAGT